MSEEKPVFKITDRRLFNPDGSPRDVERAEEPEPTPASVTAATDERRADSASATSGSGTTSTSGAGVIAGASAGMGAGASGAGASEPSRASASAPASSTSPQPEPTASTARAREEEDEAELDGDPTAFANLLMFIASPAAAAMGMTEHPGLAGHDIDLQLAKHCIDLLGTLRQKTLGRLSAQEEQMFDGILAELRMQFVSLSTARPGTGGAGSRRGGGGGFSGSDITGGR